MFDLVSVLTASAAPNQLTASYAKEGQKVCSWKVVVSASNVLTYGANMHLTSDCTTTFLFNSDQEVF